MIGTRTIARLDEIKASMCLLISSLYQGDSVLGVKEDTTKKKKTLYS